MAYNLGYTGFCEFKAMIDFLSRSDYVSASHAMLASEWANEVTSRSTSLAHVILTGMYLI